MMSVPETGSPDARYRTMFSLDECHFERTLLATRDEPASEDLSDTGDRS